MIILTPALFLFCFLFYWKGKNRTANFWINPDVKQMVAQLSYSKPPESIFWTLSFLHFLVHSSPQYLRPS